MLKSTPNLCLENLWDDEIATAMSEAERLVYRSNLLGSDMRVTNYGGGNTSSKITEKDRLSGKKVEVCGLKDLAVVWAL